MYIYGIIKKGVFMYNKLAFKNDIKALGLKKEDVLMIHSSYSSIKNIDGGANSILSVLKEEFKDGCIIEIVHRTIELMMGTIENVECVVLLTVHLAATHIIISYRQTQRRKELPFGIDTEQIGTN